MNLWNIFCRHVWEDISRKYLRSIVEYWSYGIVEMDRYDVYAVHQKCMKCQKERLVEKRIESQ